MAARYVACESMPSVAARRLRTRKCALTMRRLSERDRNDVRDGRPGRTLDRPLAIRTGLSSADIGLMSEHWPERGGPSGQRPGRRAPRQARVERDRPVSTGVRAPRIRGVIATHRIRRAQPGGRVRLPDPSAVTLPAVGQAVRLECRLPRTVPSGR